MKITERKIEELKPAAYNPRALTEKEHADLAASLKEFGMAEPIVINAHPKRKDVVIGGHQRLKIWEELGHMTIPCRELVLTPKKEKELNIRLNKNTGHWDWDVLGNNFENGDLLDWGWEEDELTGFDDGADSEPSSGPGPSEPKYVVCPKCQTEFEVTKETKA